jgi:ribosomal protein L21E
VPEQQGQVAIVIYFSQRAVLMSVVSLGRKNKKLIKKQNDLSKSNYSSLPKEILAKR